MGWVRLAVMGLILLTVIYFVVGIYSRSVRREKLEKAWDTDPAREGAAKADRTAHVEAGMAIYETGLKKKLLWLIYILPVAAFAVTVYLVNWD